MLGRQTRSHDDLDLAIAISDCAAVTELLMSCGYEVYMNEMPTRLDFRDKNGHCIDLHPLLFVEYGNGLQQLQDGSFVMYPIGVSDLSTDARTLSYPRTPNAISPWL